MGSEIKRLKELQVPAREAVWRAVYNVGEQA
jgi:hypothetical protein